MGVDTQTLHGVDDLLAKLKSLPPEIVSKRGGPVKSGLRKGAVVIQKAAQANIRAITAKPDEDKYVSTKLLESSVVVRRDPNPERAGANERYRVLVSRGKRFIYPETLHEQHEVRTIMTARYLEFGTEQRAATPWLQPAYMSTRSQALQTAVTEIQRGVDRVIKKLSKGSI